MSLPGYIGEVSLCRSSRQYRAAIQSGVGEGYAQMSAGGVMPVQDASASDGGVIWCPILICAAFSPGTPSYGAFCAIMRLLGFPCEGIPPLGVCLRWEVTYYQCGSLPQPVSSPSNGDIGDIDGDSDGCFAAHTLVFTGSGSVPIEEIEAGSEVFAYDLKTHKVKRAKVTRTHRSESDSLLLLNFGTEQVR